MACTFTEDDHFTYVNRCIDEYIERQKNLTEGGGSRGGSRKVATRRSSRFVSATRLMPILRRMSDAGFRKSIIDRYSFLTDDMLLDYHGDIFAIGVIQNYARRFSHDDTISTTLKKIGLRHTKAIHVQEILEPLLGECYTYAQIIDIAIEYLFGRCFQTIGKKNDTHYLNADVINTWNDANGRQIYNASIRCDSPSAHRALLNAIQTAVPITDNHKNNDKNNDIYNIYYHTTSWEGALSIMDGGINHSAGRKCLDFGWQGGFYIGDSAENAIQWGVKRSAATQHETAILLFRLSAADIDAKKLRYRELKGDEWKKITKKSRMCLGGTYNEMNELRRIDYIYGPMVRNVEEVARGMGEPRAHTPPKYQLVSKTDDGDEYLHDNIIGCVFFQKFVDK